MDQTGVQNFSYDTDDLMMMKGIRDPVHGWIEYNEHEMNVINTPLFQRLRMTSQLTGGSMVFPGGTNTRFLHSLGVMHIAGKYFDYLLKNSPEYKLLRNNVLKYRQLTRLAGLLHDIGHGPYSHAFDAVVYYLIYNVEDGGHDIHRENIVKHASLANAIRGCGIEPDDLIALWNPKSESFKRLTEEEQELYLILRLLVQGPIGADRIDFTLRDSYFTGTSHFGTISSDRIMFNVLARQVDRCWKLHYRFKCIQDLISALDSRFHMYENVYFNKTVYAADIIIMQMMVAAVKPLKLVERTINLDEFVYLTDQTLIGEILSSRDLSDDIVNAKKYLQMLLHRQLPKLIKEERIYKSQSDKSIDINIKPSLGGTSLYCVTPDPSDDKVIIARTRSIGGIDASKFNRLGIYFQYKNESITCEQALSMIRYVQMREPFSFVRIYKYQ